MPILESRFQPPFYLRNGHLQTILGAILPRRARSDMVTERLELPDGDFLDLDWAKAGHRRLAILSHGLEGSSKNSDIRGLSLALNHAGWDTLAWNFRGCSGESNRSLRFYHSGETGDLTSVINRAARTYPSLALVGFSLGGNMILKYLGEGGVHPSIQVAAAVSAPIDLASSARVLDRRPGNQIYLRRFMKSLAAKVEAKAFQFPNEIDATGVRDIRSFSIFDDRYTARIHGFRDAEDYWQQSSAIGYLNRLPIPALLLNAKDDPFLSPESFPYDEAHKNSCLFLETPDAGGHLGFVDGRGFWIERRIPEFLNQILAKAT